jgi:hypothetical protein
MGKHLVKCGFFSLLYKCVNIILTQIGKIALVCVCVCVCEQESSIQLIMLQDSLIKRGLIVICV